MGRFTTMQCVLAATSAIATIVILTLGLKMLIDKDTLGLLFIACSILTLTVFFQNLKISKEA